MASPPPGGLAQPALVDGAWRSHLLLPDLGSLVPGGLRTWHGTAAAMGQPGQLVALTGAPLYRCVLPAPLAVLVGVALLQGHGTAGEVGLGMAQLIRRRAERDGGPPLRP